jgi:hypothetical protein
MKITMRERMRRVGVLMNLATDDAEAQARFGAFLQGLQEFNSAGLSAAMSFRVELSRIGLSDAEQIERSVAAFARTSNGGLIVSRTSEAIAHRALITCRRGHAPQSTRATTPTPTVWFRI